MVQHDSFVWRAIVSLKFQYIKCDGSAAFFASISSIFAHFNTSNVMVQLDPTNSVSFSDVFQYIKCDGSAR